jgi:hypothetical protein
VVAENFEAMVKLGELNSRMKDFFDIWMRSRTGQFRSAELSQAIEQTFSRRGTELVPDPICFTEEFATNSSKANQWRSFLRRNTYADVPDSFSSVIESSPASSGPLLFAPLRSSLWIRFGALADRGHLWNFGDASCRTCQSMSSFLDQENASFGWYR